MKVGVDYCLEDGVRKPLIEEDGRAYGAPVRIDGNVFLPLGPIAEYFGYSISAESNGNINLTRDGSALTVTLGKTTAIVGVRTVELESAPAVMKNGEKEYFVVHKDDVEKLFAGKYVTYDEMGLVILSARKNVVSRENGYDEMLSMMKSFIYDYSSEEQIYNKTKENTDGFKHPYLYADEERFEYLRKCYEACADGEENSYYDEYFTWVLKDIVVSARFFLSNHAKKDKDGTYLGLVNPPKNPYDTPDGYDPVGGRLTVDTGSIVECAFAYKMTGDTDYLRLTYDWIIALGEWEHWGPGHFLNCADATAPVAQVYDWLYNDFEELGLDVDRITDIIYEKGVHMGYLCATGAPCPYPSDKQGGANNWSYRYHPNNWNAVCSSGMIAGALAIMGDDRYKEESAFLIKDNIYQLTNCGLDLYAPDGSYVESAGYWAYGTNALFRLIGALDSACGTDFGLMDTWGLDKTCYFACHVESSEQVSWSYHDGTAHAVDTCFFSFVAQYTDNGELMQIRKKQVENGKKAKVWDALYYKDMGFSGELGLEYKMEGIDGYTVRSSWDKTAIFAGLMGGSNNVPHGQIDAGNFTYHNGGVIWFSDLGADDYNIGGYFSNYKLYRRNAEGQNVLCMTTLPDERRSDFYGQYRHYATAPIVDDFSNEYGAYAILDTSSVYPGTVTKAKRGMLFTNSRSSVIIQDEITATSPVSFYWFGHYGQSISKVSISEDGKSAYLEARSSYTGMMHKLRVSLMSDNTTLRFKRMTAYDLVLGSSNKNMAVTYSPEQVISLGGAPEKSRQGQEKLAIEINNVKSLRLAVVIEDITEYEALAVGYSLTNMSEWVPIEETRQLREPITPLEELFGKPSVEMFIVSSNKLGIYSSRGREFSTEFLSYYFELARLEYYRTALDYNPESQWGQNALDAFLEHKEKYSAYAEAINGISLDVANKVNQLLNIM